MDVNELYQTLIDSEMFTKDELDLVTNINGYSIESLNDCIYARYGYHDLDQVEGSK
jgi:hypothetical protein